MCMMEIQKFPLTKLLLRAWDLIHSVATIEIYVYVAGRFLLYGPKTHCIYGHICYIHLIYYIIFYINPKLTYPYSLENQIPTISLL